MYLKNIHAIRICGPGVAKYVPMSVKITNYLPLLSNAESAAIVSFLL